MAMNLRLSAELDSALDALARDRQTSKHALIVEAANRFVSQETKLSVVLESVDDTDKRYATLIEHLKDA